MSGGGASDAPAVALRDVRFAYRPGVDVLDIAQLTIGRGETVFLHGPSGSGKTTLLGLLAGVLQATAGEVRLLELGTGRVACGYAGRRGEAAAVAFVSRPRRILFSDDPLSGEFTAMVAADCPGLPLRRPAP